MNAAFCIYEIGLMADDDIGEKTPEFNEMTLAIGVANDGETERVFTAVGEGGNVTMPLAKPFKTSLFGMWIEKFGVP